MKTVKFYLKILVLFIGLISGFSQTGYSVSWCTPTVANYAPYGIGMTNVTMGTPGVNGFSNSSGTTSIYTDYSATCIVSGRGGDVIPFSVTLGTGNPTSFRIFIDWNNDGTFNTSGSEVVYTSSSYTPGSIITGSFTVPCSISTGNLRIRVSGDLGLLMPGTPPSPCANQYGEFEDYTFNMLSPFTFDVAMISLINPTLWNVGNNSMSIYYQNRGTTTITTANFGYKLDNGSAVVNSGVTITGGLTSCSITHYNFPSPVSSTAGTHTIKVWVNNPNGANPDGNPNNDTMTFSFCTPVSGNFVIDAGGSGNFKTFNAALNSLTCGSLGGPVYFSVKPGTYNERLVIPHIYGMSATNTITFDGLNKANVTLTWAGTAQANRATIVLNGTNYVTFKNITIQNTGNSYGVGVFLTNVARNNNFINGSITVSGNTISSIIPILSSTAEGTTSSGADNADSNTFTNNLISGGYYGAYMNGNASSTPCIYNNFIGNTFTNQYMYGLYNYYQGNSTIQYNTFKNFSSSAAYAYYSYFGVSTLFDGNIINPGEYGALINYENYYSTGSKSYFSNNMICNFQNTSNQVGMQFYYYCYNMNILHNSIYLTMNAAFKLSLSYQYACLYLYGYISNPIIENNILVSTGTGYLLSAFYNPSGTAHQVDYNDYYYPNSTSDKFYWQNTTTTASSYLNFSMFKSATYFISVNHDANSFDNINPNFLSNTDLHLSSLFAPMYGLAGLGINYDVDGNTRCLISPSIGCDESTYPYPKPSAYFTSNDTTYTGILTDFLYPTNPGVPYSYQWYVNGSSAATTYNYSNVFTTPGKYTVSYVVKGCFVQDSFGKYVVVLSPTKAPKALFTVNSNSVNVSEVLIAKDLSLYGPQKWTWTITPALKYNSTTGLMDSTYKFVTGSTKHSENPSLTFLIAGTYSMQLTVSNVFGADSIIKSNYILVKPSLSICSDQVANQNYGMLTDDGGVNGNYSMGRDCEFLLTPCSPNVIITFQSFNLGTGAFLRIYDGIDTNGTPVYNTTIYPKGFTGFISSNTIFTSNTGKFFFRFITGTSATAPGFVITWVAEPIITSAPKASFTIPDTLCLGKTYKFLNTSTGYGNEYSWDVNNDGNYENQPYDVNFSFTYTAPYTGKVKLIATNCGGSDTFIKNVVAMLPNVAPKPNFYANTQVPLKNSIVTLTDTTINCEDTRKWSFSNAKHVHFQNGTNNISSHPQVSFDTTGCYDVKLVVSSNGHADSITQYCFIDVLNYCIPTVAISNTDIGISNVTIGNINNYSQINNTVYTDYTSTCYTKIYKTVPSSISVSRLSAINAMTIAVWIDLNMDGIFEPNERVAYTASISGITWITNFTIPLSQPNCVTRMRVGTNITPLPDLACGLNKNGEFEDYEVEIASSAAIPVITLNGADTIYLERGNTFKDPGAIAFDPVQGNISASLIITNNINKYVPGKYQVKYNVTDSFGNQAKEVIRLVIITPDVTPPVITLTGGDSINWNVNIPWVEPGYTAIDYPLGTNLTSKVIVTGSVKVNVLGTSILTYTVFDSSGNKASRTRTIFVKDIMPPVIKLLGNTIMHIEVYTSYKEPGYTVTDNYWKHCQVVVTNSVDTATVGTYILTYSSQDSSGNKTTPLTRTIYVEDTIRPVITLKGSDTVQVEVGTAYVETGANVTDNYCLLSHNVKITGTINTNILGTYILNYDIADCEGNNAITVHRYVEVIDNIAPVVTLIGPANNLVYRWQTYLEEGYTLSDNYWAKNKIKVDTLSDFVNTNSVGLYTIQYKATDGSGNIGYSAMRTIDVEDNGGGINSSAYGYWINIYPNPTHGMVDVSLTMPQVESISLALYDICGKEMVRIYDGNMQKQVFNLDLSGYSKGMYFLKLKTQDRQMVQKIIIN